MRLDLKRLKLCVWLNFKNLDQSNKAKQALETEWYFEIKQFLKKIPNL